LPSKRAHQRFGDIIYNIDAIGRYTAGMTQARFLADEKTYDATLACLQRISEAAKKLGKLAEQLEPEQPWRNIRGIGNILRHDYDVVDKSRVWLVVSQELGSLRAACERSIDRIQDGIDHAPQSEDSSGEEA
jgi:uncharacterized protein with HEPN domain